MTQVGFYHLTRSRLDEVLPRLLERVLGAGHRVVVKAGDAAEVERLDALLWTFEEGSFLPHGSARDGWEAEQPIYLTETDDNPAAADVLCLTGGTEAAEPDRFTRILDVFDGANEQALAAARDRWRRHKAAGRGVSYWQQKPGGGWEKKA